MIPVLLVEAITAGDGRDWLDVTDGVIVPTLAIIGGLLGVVLAYRHQQKENRRVRLRDLFGEALRAIADYQELPYLVRRRSDQSPMTPADLAHHASDVQTRLDYYVARLRLESPDVANPYDALVLATRQEAGAQISSAWAEARVTSDAAMPLGTAYSRERADGAKQPCIEAMQAYLQA